MSDPRLTDLAKLARGMPSTQHIKDADTRRVIESVKQILAYLLKAVDNVAKRLADPTIQSIFNRQSMSSTVNNANATTSIFNNNISNDDRSFLEQLIQNYVDSHFNSFLRPGTYDAEMSVVLANRKFSLSGDAVAPGNSKLYGTDAAGERGWQDVPEAEVKDSLEVAGDGKIHLKGDEETPSSMKVYGVAGTGRGWLSTSVQRVLTGVVWNGTTLVYTYKDAYVIDSSVTEEKTETIDTPVEHPA